MKRNRLSLVIAAVALLAAGAAYGGYWLFAANQMRDLVAQWVANAGSAGLEVDHGAIENGGFPGLITLTVANPAVRRLDGRWAWSAGALSLSVKPWDLTVYRVDADGHQTIDAVLRDRPWRFTLSSGEAFGLVSLHLDGALESAEIQFDQPVLTADQANSPVYAADRLVARLGLPENRPATHLDPLADVTMLVEGLTLPERLDGPLGTDVSRLRFDAAMRGDLQDGDAPVALAAWREAGGTVDLKWLHLAWGPVDLKTSGTLSLDAALRPIGALKADIAGYGEVIDAFVRAGLLGRDAGRLFRSGLSLIAKPSQADGRPVISVPLTAQDGHLFLGPFQLTDLPPVVE